MTSTQISSFSARVKDNTTSITQGTAIDQATTLTADQILSDAHIQVDGGVTVTLPDADDLVGAIGSEAKVGMTLTKTIYATSGTITVQAGTGDTLAGALNGTVTNLVSGWGIRLIIRLTNVTAGAETFTAYVAPGLGKYSNFL